MLQFLLHHLPTRLKRWEQQNRKKAGPFKVLTELPSDNLGVLMCAK